MSYIIMELQLSVDTQIDELVKENKLHRFALELQHTENETRKSELREVINVLRGTKEQTDENCTKNKFNKLYSSIADFSLKRKWSRLTHAQKQDRIKYFVQNSPIPIDDKLKPKVEQKLLTMLENESLKPKYVEYNVDTGTITMINIHEEKKQRTPTVDRSRAPLVDSSRAPKQELINKMPKIVYSSANESNGSVSTGSSDYE